MNTFLLILLVVIWHHIYFGRNLFCFSLLRPEHKVSTVIRHLSFTAVNNLSNKMILRDAKEKEDPIACWFDSRLRYVSFRLAITCDVC